MTAVLVVRFVLGSAVVLGLLWASARLAARYGSPGASRTSAGMRVVARRQLGKGLAVVRLAVEDKDLLLACSPKGVELLCELPASAAEQSTLEADPPLLTGASGGAAPTSFASALKHAIGLRQRRQRA